MIETDFYIGSSHVYSYQSLRLIEQKCEIQPAPPKMNFIEVPGMNGSLDLTEALGIGVRYGDREITWTYALYPGADWRMKQSEVSNALNGKRMCISVHGDSTFYYDGRVTVENYAADKMLRQITVKAICKPYKLKKNYSSTSKTVTSSGTSITINVGGMPLQPELTATTPMSLSINGTTYTVSGSQVVPNAPTLQGSMTFTATAITGASGTLTIRYRAGSL